MKKGRPPFNFLRPASYEWQAIIPDSFTSICFEADSKQTYVGFTQDLRKRLEDHNAGKAKHTSKFRPWKLETYVAFSNVEKARAFETYLKSASGIAFANKRLR